MFFENPNLKQINSQRRPCFRRIIAGSRAALNTSFLMSFPFDGIVNHQFDSGNTQIEISVYDHKIIFWNQGQLPETWTLESLTAKHHRNRLPDDS